MATQTDIPSSSSSSQRIWWTYDVFLSFRGDTRKGFADHLYKTLIEKGISTFRDQEEVRKGKNVWKELLEAIEKSRYVIVVLSRDYADSTWCLKEIAKAVECSQGCNALTIFPVFYDVNPSDVRKQQGHFGSAFEKHEKESEPETVQRWRHALSEVGNLNGWHVQDRYNSEVVQEIVEKIFEQLSHTTARPKDDLVGMDSHRKQMFAHLDKSCPKVRIVGIWGMGGIGKSTIARAVFESIRAEFDCYSFLEHIREISGKQGIVQLQKQLLLNLLKSTMNLDSVTMGIDLISRRVRTKKVLIILDDVDQEEQVKAFCDKRWFGQGSRIIITSRNGHLLGKFVDETYNVKPLTHAEALQFFNSKAFKTNHVGDDFLKLSEDFLAYARGHPLAINVLGSFLYGRDKKSWLSALERLKENPDDRITQVLKVSYDGLRQSEKMIFLDIACSFETEDKGRVIRTLGSDSHDPEIDINVLIDKSLVTLQGEALCMHDLIQELGREIIRLECRDDPEKRSRLWLPKDIFTVLKDKEESDAVRSICLTLPKEEEAYLHVDDPFSKMRKLRLLRIQNVKFTGDIRYLPTKLQLLEWHGCPLVCLPPDANLESLVELIMHSSRVKELWRGTKVWSMLKLIDMSDSQYLTKTPNFTGVPNIEILVLEGCTKLFEVHPSIGFLKKLVSLNMGSCKSLENLPPFKSLDSLKTFILSACSRLRKFPEIEGNMTSLFELHLDGTAIEELPRSIGHLTALTFLNLEDCKNLLRLPSIEHLPSLKTLILTGCSKLHEIPENWSCIEYLDRLDISGTAIRDTSTISGMKNLRSLSLRGCKDLDSKSLHSFFHCWWWSRRPVPTSLLLPSSLSGLRSLTHLNLSDCNLTEGATYPSDLGSLRSLRVLNLSTNNFSSLPDISLIPKLAYLDLSNCRRLQSLPRLPFSIRHIDAEDCTSLTDFPNQFKVWTSADYGVTTLNSLISSEGQEYHPSTLRYANRKYKTAASPRMTTFSMSSIDEQPITSVPEFTLPIEVSQKDFELELWHSRTSTIQFSTVCSEPLAKNLGFKNTGTRGNSIPIRLPQNLDADVKWMGLAVIFSVKSIPVTSGNRASYSGTSNFLFECVVRTPEYQVGPFLYNQSFPIGSYNLGVFYVSSGQLSSLLNSSHIRASVTNSNPSMEVQSCEIRFLYEQDVSDFFQMMIERARDSEPAGTTAGCTCKAIVLADAATSDLDKATLEAGWFNLGVDKILKWETSIPTPEEGSIVLLSRNIESLLPRYLLGLNVNKSYDFDVNGTSAWFNPKVGHTISIPLPDNLHKSKNWMGFVHCVSIAVDRHDHLREESANYLCSCALEFYGNYTNYRYTAQTSVKMDRHQLWVNYFPRARFPDWLIESSSGTTIRTSFTSNTPYVAAQLCGFRILFQQDLPGFVQAITQATLRVDHFFQKNFSDLVTSDWIDFLRFGSPVVETKFTADAPSSSTRPALAFEHIPNWCLGWFSTVIPGAQLPKWFEQTRRGNSADVQLSSDLFCDSNWMGVFVCVYVSIHDYPTTVFNTTPDFGRVLFCCLDTDGYSAGTVRLASQPNNTLWLHGCDFIYLVHISRSEIPDSWNQCTQLRAEITSDSFGLGFHECGVGLVFKNNVEELIQVLRDTKLSAYCPHCERSSEESEDDG